MAWTTSRTWTIFDVATSSLLNTYLRDNTNFLHDPPGASWTLTTATAISVATGSTFAAFTGSMGAGTVELWDTDTMHSTSSNAGRITVKTAGTYNIVGNGQWASNATGLRRLAIFWNGTVHTGVNCPNGSAITVEQSIRAVINASVNDYFELGGAQNSGGALNVQPPTNDATHEMFTATWAGAG